MKKERFRVPKKRCRELQKQQDACHKGNKGEDTEKRPAFEVSICPGCFGGQCFCCPDSPDAAEGNAGQCPSVDPQDTSGCHTGSMSRGRSQQNGWHPAREPFSSKRFWGAILSGVPALLMPVFIIVCVSGGVCTASESAGVAVLYSALVGFFLYKELTWGDVWNALKKTLISSSSVMIIIGFTQIFTWILTIQKVPDIVANFFLSMNMSRIGIALMFDVLILIIGTFIDVSPAILLLTPIMLPVMQSYGFSALQFGAMMITGLAIGLVTPPVGMCLNACNKINRMPIIEIFKGAAPYVVCNVIVLIAISVWPQLTAFLPNLLGY